VGLSLSDDKASEHVMVDLGEALVPSKSEATTAAHGRRRPR
jgi:hypothetical protein